MFTRPIFDTSGAMADSDHLAGALIFTFSIVAFAEVARPLRAINMLLGGWLVLAPWLLDGASGLASAMGVVVGVLLIVLAIPRGPMRNQYDVRDRYLIW